MMEVRFWCRLADEKIIRQRRAGNHCVLLEIANSRLTKNILIDAEIARKTSALLDEDHVSGVGHDFWSSAARTGQTEVLAGGRIDHRSWPECVHRDANGPKLFSHTEDAHAHAILGDRVAAMLSKPSGHQIERRRQNEDVRIRGLR